MPNGPDEPTKAVKRQEVTTRTVRTPHRTSSDSEAKKQRVSPDKAAGRTAASSSAATVLGEVKRKVARAV